MSAMRLLVGSAASGRAVRVDVKELSAAEALPFCEVLTVSAVAGVYDSTRGHLTVPTAPTSRLSDLPENVHALVCSCASAGSQPEYVVLLSPERGVSLVLPREAAISASQVRIRAALPTEMSAANNFIVLASGSDPYAALVDATKALSRETGVSVSQTRTYVLPLLDAVNRLRYDAALAAARATANGGPCSKAAQVASQTSALEQQLHEGILVQAGPDCPAKPLLQAPGLRLCPGMSAPVGLRYSGMSVVYGTATGHVLAVMETAAALKMAPPSNMRTSTTGGSLGIRVSLPAYNSVGTESPSAVSAGVSAATSAAPSPPISRANSCGGLPADVTDSSSASTSPSVAVAPAFPPPVKVMSGRSITAAPVIQVLAASTATAGKDLEHEPSTPTGAPAQVLASFALLGMRPNAGRDSVVRCCRIMPSGTMVAQPAAGEGAGGATQIVGGLGLAVQVEVTTASSGSLLMFLEGPEEDLSLEPDHDLYDGTDASLVRAVKVDGRPAKWRYDTTGGVLKVDLPAAAPTAAPHMVQVFL